MWFLYFCITAIIVIFSASQLISSIKAINKFPDMNKDVKQKLLISIAFHSIINIIWIIVILSVNAINKNYVAIIIAYLITLPIAFFMSSKVTLNDINNLGSSANNTNNTQSDLKQYEEYAKKYDLENEVTNDAVFNSKRKILSTKFNENFDNIADYTVCHVGNIKCDVFVFVPKETFEQQHILIIKLLTKK